MTGVLQSEHTQGLFSCSPTPNGEMDIYPQTIILFINLGFVIEVGNAFALCVQRQPVQVNIDIITLSRTYLTQLPPIHIVFYANQSGGELW